MNLTAKQQLQQQVDALCKIEPAFEKVQQLVGLPKLRLRQQGFLSLYQSIVSQQLTTKAADAIWSRLLAAGFNSEASILASCDTELRACGLSKQKISYVRSLVAAEIDYEQLRSLADESVIKQLTVVKGIGRWTAEIYCLFVLNRPDIFAANDLALQAASAELFALAERPTEKQMRQLASKWSPYRSTAAYLLWAYYGYLKKQKTT